MNLNQDLPLRFFINLGRRNDRRAETEWNLFEAGISAERFPAVDCRFVKGRRGYTSKGRYALALTQRLAIRKARQRSAVAVLLLEDDVRLHPNFLALLERLELPDDWGMFYLGCAHHLEPEVVSDGLVRIAYAVDTHAVAIHSRYYDRIIEALDLSDKPDFPDIGASDRVLAQLQKEIPTYAALPNLAWQAMEKSDLTDTSYSNYYESGVAKRNYDLTHHALEKMVLGSTGEQNARLGLLFLTRGDVHHPDIWREWIDQAPEQVRLLSHAKNPELANDLLSSTQIAKHVETEWGSMGLVHATRALLLEALQDNTLTHFALLSESCVPVRPLRDVLRRLHLDPRPQFHSQTFDKASELKKGRALRSPGLPLGSWRFQSQWWLLDRLTATMVSRNNHTALFQDTPIPDECYFATVLHMEGYPLETFVFPEASTWTHWGTNAGSPTSHETLTTEYLRDILRSNAHFARKFPPGADIGQFTLHLPKSPDHG